MKNPSVCGSITTISASTRPLRPSFTGLNFSGTSVVSIEEMFSRIAFKDGQRKGYILGHKRMEYHGISWHIMEYHGISWNIMEYHGISYSMSFSSSIPNLTHISNIGISWNILGVIASGISEHYVTQQHFWRISGKNHGDE